jgi:hypothetical protein
MTFSAASASARMRISFDQRVADNSLPAAHSGAISQDVSNIAREGAMATSWHDSPAVQGVKEGNWPRPSQGAMRLRDRSAGKLPES